MQQDRLINARSAAAIALAVLGGAALAQTVCESRVKSGAVFSDKPSAGASAVQLPAPNGFTMPAVQAAYRDFVIVAAAAQGSIHSNIGAFEVKARLAAVLHGACSYRAS